jgi:hypothetical protein
MPRRSLSIDAAAPELVRGVYKLKNRLLLVPDPNRTLKVDEQMKSRTAGLN